MCRLLLCCAVLYLPVGVSPAVVPTKVKVSEVREQLQQQLDELAPKCLNEDD
jgi:hypothetical protein